MRGNKNVQIRPTSFRIRGLVFEIHEQDHKPTGDGMPQFAMKVIFEDGSHHWISHDYGLADTESGCCFQAMLWMERAGI